MQMSEFRPWLPKRYQILEFLPISGTTSIPAPNSWESPWGKVAYQFVGFACFTVSLKGFHCVSKVLNGSIGNSKLKCKILNCSIDKTFSSLNCFRWGNSFTNKEKTKCVTTDGTHVNIYMCLQYSSPQPNNNKCWKLIVLKNY